MKQKVLLLFLAFNIINFILNCILFNEKYDQIFTYDELNSVINDLHKRMKYRLSDLMRVSD
jgi:hypothetical protein